MSIKHNIIFIDKTKSKEKENFFCDICEHVLKTKKDFDISKKYKICHNCFLKFVESRKKEWENGWRPDKTKLKEYIYK
jgi:ubiquitin C-terminal hydrolase